MSAGSVQQQRQQQLTDAQYQQQLQQIYEPYQRLGFTSDIYQGNIPSGATGSALIEEILVERRKELYGEPPAVEWFDAKRLGRGITRTGNHRVKGNASLAPNDKRFYLKVPQFEIDANPNITDAVNANR